MKQDFSVRKSMGFYVLLRKSYRKVEQIWQFLKVTPGTIKNS